MLVQTRSIQHFEPLMAELEFGDRFCRSMRNWCGMGERPYPLAFWQVYLAQIDRTAIGVCGLYQFPDTPPEEVWLGWLGIRPQFRRQGWGTQMLKQIMDRAIAFGFRDVWVFTETDNQAAIAFYQNAGFTELGPASTLCSEVTHDLTDVVLRCRLK